MPCQAARTDGPSGGLEGAIGLRRGLPGTTMNLITALLMSAIAMAIDITAGYPARLFAAIGHPTTWMGALIAALDRRFNDPAERPDVRRGKGVLALGILLVIVAFGSSLVQIMLLAMPLGVVLTAIAASSLIAERSLDEHVDRVARGLDQRGLEGGREAVSMIVGRDPDALDGSGVARAAIESLAENFSDGVVAPVVWMGVLGLPGGALYKAINTADSMIGHRTPRYESFGWAAARLDDIVNLPASRLAALLLVLAALIVPGADAGAAWRAVRMDARRHRSPNAGWPEAAMAGALGLRLAGPRAYGGTMVQDAYMGDGRPDATSADIGRALVLYRVACLLQLAAILSLAGLILIARP